MAGRGPAPKPAAARARRNKSSEPAIDTEAVALVAEIEAAAGTETLRGPELPDDFEWPAATISWWHNWRTSSQAITFLPTDWDVLLETAVLHAEFWLGARGLAAELRLRVAKFGATIEDRERLKGAVGAPPPVAAPVAAKPTGLQAKKSTQRQTRLLKAVGDGEG